ncbi:MAG: tetratricopeptide repeat protein [Flavobacteriia bacterium]|jgi:hypothetical protein
MSAPQQVQSPMDALLMYLELGNLSGKNGNDQEAIDYYIKGLQIAREIEDRPRIQQLSNLILTFI